MSPPDPAGPPHVTAPAAVLPPPRLEFAGMPDAVDKNLDRLGGTNIDEGHDCHHAAWRPTDARERATLFESRMSGSCRPEDVPGRQHIQPITTDLT